ncbi:MAG: hypothetical protein P4L41_00620 [Flavipsychrobacter sp.]|nr:hypothetical protein [Flavipsychrobacter sp.]
MAKHKSKDSPGIPDLYIRFYHAELENISDGTFRQLIREYSKITNDILRAEIEFLLLKINLKYREKQSIQDKLYSRFSETTNFYIDKIEKGSLLLVGVIAATSILTLGFIVSSVVEEFTKGRKQKISEADAEIVNSYLIKHLSERNQILLNHILPQFENKALGNRFFIERFISEENMEGNTVITAQIASTKEGKVAENIVENNSYVQAELLKLGKPKRSRKQ